MVVVVKDEGRKERAGDDYRAELGPWQREFEDCRRIRLLVKIGLSAFVRLTFCDGISHASVHRRCHFCSHSLKVLGYVICDISALFPFWAHFSRDQSCDRAPRLPRVGIGPSCDWPLARTPRLDRPPCPPPSSQTSSPATSATSPLSRNAPSPVSRTYSKTPASIHPPPTPPPPPTTILLSCESPFEALLCPS